MKRVVLILLSWLVILSSATGQEKEAGTLLSAAKYEEEVTGDLNKAIEMYGEIISSYPGENEVAAEALLHLGFCYEKLGKTEAINAYETILARYSGQKAQASAAQARLRALKKEEKGEFMVRKVNFGITEPFNLSPDGTRMVGVDFSVGQNIGISHLEQEKIELITRFDWSDEFYWAYNPVWSPDGKMIAYNVCFEDKENHSFHTLRVSDLKGNERILLEGGNSWNVPNAWAPDGNTLLIVSEDQQSRQALGLVNVRDGSFSMLDSLNGQIMTSGRSRATAGFSPDGKYIVYTDVKQGGNSDLFVIGSGGGDHLPLTSHPAEDKWPRWAPDGKHIIFLSNRHGSMALWAIEVTQGTPAGEPFLVLEGMGNNIFGNWTEHGLVSWNWIRVLDIYRLNVNESDGQPISGLKLLDYAPTGNNSRACYAPNGKQLAFLRTNEDLGKGYLVICAPDGSDAKDHEIPAGISVGSLRWLPDGSGVSASASDRTERNLILKLHLESSEWESIQLPMEQDWITFDWTPDGRHLLMAKNGSTEGGAGIIEYNPESGEERHLYRPAHDGRVLFRGLKCSNDYTMVAFLENNRTLVSLDLSSGEYQTVTEGSWWMPSWWYDGQNLMTIGSKDQESEDTNLYLFNMSGVGETVYKLNNYLPDNSRITGYQPSPADGTVMISLDLGKSEHMIYRNIISAD